MKNNNSLSHQEQNKQNIPIINLSGSSVHIFINVELIFFLIVIFDVVGVADYNWTCVLWWYAVVRRDAIKLL